MPINPADLKTKLLFASADDTLARLLPRVPEWKLRQDFYVVLHAPDDSYYAAAWPEIEQFAWDNGPGNVQNMPLLQLGVLHGPLAAVDRATTSKQQALTLSQAQPGKILVVLDGGVPSGVFTLQLLSAAGETDPFATMPSFDPVVLGGDERQPPTTPPTQPQAALDDRVFNAWVADQSASAPLLLGQSYVLCFNVDSPRAGATTVSFDAAKAFAGLPPEVQTVDITVALESEDFEILGDDQAMLTVPRTGKSVNEVRFEIEPKRNGVGMVQAVFIANNRIFQKMTITLQVGSLTKGTTTWAADARGVAMSGTVVWPQREQVVNLVIERRDAGYQMKLIGGGIGKAFLNLSEQKVAELILRARDTLKGIVYQQSPNNQFVYQQLDTTIAPEIHSESLKTLAKLGFYLYQELFFAPGNGADAQSLGRLLRQISQQQQLRISVIAERFIFPWALLYDREKVDLNNLDPSGFWGFKHVVEYLPEFANPTPVSFNPQIEVADTLKLGFVCNRAIDDELSRKGLGPIVKPQSEFLKNLAGVAVTEYPNRGDLYGLLGDPDCNEQFLYFYCHAVSNLPGEQGGVDGSRFVLSDGAASVADMKLEAPINGDPLRTAPLVFLNACQSAELSPFLYDGLIPYLIGKGVRGVVGTEVDTPALFAAEFGREFLSRFTAGGQTLGELLLAMRQEYLTKKNNVMGLLYALYSNGEVVVKRIEND